MKNYLLLLLFFFALTGCRNEPKDGGAEAAATEQSAGQPQSPDPQSRPASQNEAALPEVGARPAYTPPVSEDVLTIMAQNTSARQEADVCVSIRVKGFTNLLAMQYTMAWDPKVVEFKAVDKPGLPYLDQADFGFNRVKEGLLPFVWINDALQATTIPDESVIYQVCFKAIGVSGQSSPIRFVEQPTPFEVVNVNEEIQQLKPVAGKVVIE